MMNEFKQTLDKVNSLQQTENGATGYSTTGKNLVDLNFRVPSNHNNVGLEDIHIFMNALKEDKLDAVKWLFYLRDVREGLGERTSFVNLFMVLASYDEESALKVLSLIPEYGRWKDLIDIYDRSTVGSNLANAIGHIIDKQLKEDCINMKEGKSVSLLAKWLPSINASKKSRKVALRLANGLKLYSEAYRKMLSALRKYIDVTEVKTCGDKWSEIDYNKVSSNANARYLKAFMKHDSERRQKYLEALSTPQATGAVMHASNLYPYEVYAKYNLNNQDRHFNDWYSDPEAVADPGIEALWANLKNIQTLGNTMVVCDGSGSMKTRIKGSNIMAIDVSRALSIFFSERNTGEYKDKVIEFSKTPRYIDLSKCNSLADKYNHMCKFTDCSNTNLEAVFDLLLETAIQNNIPQDELPQRLLIVSDMEFDKACEFTAYDYPHNTVMAKYQTLFETIKEKWTAAGYQMPNIVFWNVNSRTQTIPVSVNEAGVILVAGFSVNSIKLVLSGETNPWTALKSVLDSDRYKAIETALGV
jgi:hypothetical protein